MKTPEDEAFDELAKKQGAWGGGFQAKRAAAADKQRPWIGLTPEETSGFTQHEMTVVKYVSKVLQEKNT